MINSVLFKKSLKSNYKVFTIILAVITMYVFIIVAMFDPDDMSAISSLTQMKFPPELLNALGFDLEAVTLTGFISSFLYGMIMLVFPMISYIIIANKLIASMVDKGSMANILSTPISRKKVAFTQAVFLICSVVVMVAYTTIIIIVECKIAFPDLLRNGAFIKLNFGLLLLHYALSSICYLSSCTFNDSSKSLTFGAGIPILFYVFKMIADSGKKVSNFKYLTLHTLFNNKNIIDGKSVWLPFLILFLVGTALYTLSIYVFNKKDICL